MKGLVVVNKGIEKISAKEIKELIKAKNIEIGNGCLSFDFKNLTDLCILCYKAQSVSRVLLLLKEFKIKQTSDLKELESIDFTKYIDSEQSFASRCYCDRSSTEIEGESGKIIIDSIKKKTGKKQEVDLENPDIVFFTYINKQNAYFGIDFSGEDLSKRGYKIFGHRRALKGTIAYSLLRTADYDAKKTLIDPFCNEGSIVIEAALFAKGFPVNYYEKDKFAFAKLKQLKGIDWDSFYEKQDKIKNTKLSINAFDSEQRFVKAAEKNAKIAGIVKDINFSRIEVEWLDTKFKEKEVDLIITNPPRVSKHAKKQEFEKMYKELFYQAKYILKNKGRVLVIGRKLEILKNQAEHYDFKVSEEHEVYQGKEILKIAVFEK